MIDTLKKLEWDMKVAQGGKYTTAIKSVMNTDGITSYTLMTSSRYSKNEKIDPAVAKEYLKKHDAKLTKLGWNKASTDVHIRIKK